MTNFFDDQKGTNTFVDTTSGGSVICFQIGSQQDHKRVFTGLPVGLNLLGAIANITEARVGWVANVSTVNTTSYDVVPLGIDMNNACSITFECTGSDGTLQRESLYIPYCKGRFSTDDLDAICSNLVSDGNFSSVRITAVKYSKMR